MTTENKIGESQPTDESKAMLDSLVNDVVDSPSEEKEVKKPEVEEPTVESEGLGDEDGDVEDNDSEDKPDAKAEGVDESEESDDVIPASKVKKIQEKMQKRIDDLTRELRDKEASSKKKNASQEERLEHLSISQLQELRENVDDSIVDLKVEAKVDGVDISSKLQEYRELKRNIDSTIKNGPQRFQNKQISNLEAMIAEVKEIDPEVEAKRGKLWEAANTIYNRMPSLARSETGMAEAMAMAAEHILSFKRVSSGRDQVKSLNQAVTKLKQKTSLDTRSKSVDTTGESFKKLKGRAVNGTLDDKTAFVASLIPDDFLS